MPHGERPASVCLQRFDATILRRSNNGARHFDVKLWRPENGTFVASKYDY
jgi:hypothetical protein